MSLAEKQALALRDLALIVAKLKGKLTAPDLYSYKDARIRIEYAIMLRDMRSYLREMNVSEQLADEMLKTRSSDIP
jgi:hypothetical protein